MGKKIVYETLKHNYSYGNLAMDNFWDGVEDEERQKHRLLPRRKMTTPQKSFLNNVVRNPLVKDEKAVIGKPKKSDYAGRAKMVKMHAIAAIAFIVAANLGCVVVNQLILSSRLNLVALQRTEMELLGINNELRIQVEELKGPDRIRDIAMKDLKMVVSRDNVYVPASKSVSVRDVYGKRRIVGSEYAVSGE